MRLLKSTIVALALFATPALAADIATKTPPPAPAIGYPYAASGFYFGVGASASAGSSTIANTGVFSTGAGVDLDVGYQWKGGLDFIALEFDATYTNLGASATCNPALPEGCATDSNWELEPLVKFGFPVSVVTAALPNLSSIFPALPALPASLTSTSVHPYLYGGVPIRDVSANYGLASNSVWNVQGELGVGMLYQLTQGLVADTRAGCSFGGGSLNLTGPAGVKGTAEENTICETKIDFLY